MIQQGRAWRRHTGFGTAASGLEVEPEMTPRGKGFLVAVTVFTGAGIWAVHWTQVVERQNLHQGVIRDEELYARKLAELGLQQQQEQRRQ